MVMASKVPKVGVLRKITPFLRSYYISQKSIIICRLHFGCHAISSFVHMRI